MTNNDYLERLKEILGRFNDGFITGADRDSLFNEVFNDMLEEVMKG